MEHSPLPRVGFFDCYVAQNSYGTHRYIEAVFRHCRPADYQLLFICPHGPDRLSNDSPLHNQTVFVEAPDRLLRFGGATFAATWPEKLRLCLSLIAYNVELARVLRRERVRVVQCTSTRNLLTCGLAAKLAGARLLWYVNGHLDNPILDRVCFFVADRILFQNGANMRRRYPMLVNWMLGRIRIIENAIDVDELASAVSADQQKRVEATIPALAAKGAAARVGYVGQLAPLKAVEDLLEATQKLRQEGRVEVFVIGDHGVEEFRAHAEALMSQYRASPGVHFFGYRRDALTILSLMDAFVLPSLSEGVPRSVLEAMACGVPVIATEVGGLPELIEDGVNGLLVPPGQPLRIATAIEHLLDHPEVRDTIAAVAAERVQHRWTFQQNVPRLVALHRELLAPARWRQPTEPG